MKPGLCCHYVVVGDYYYCIIMMITSQHPFARAVLNKVQPSNIEGCDPFPPIGKCSPQGRIKHKARATKTKNWEFGTYLSSLS